MLISLGMAAVVWTHIWWSIRMSQSMRLTTLSRKWEFWKCCCVITTRQCFFRVIGRKGFLSIWWSQSTQNLSHHFKTKPDWKVDNLKSMFPRFQDKTQSLRWLLNYLVNLCVRPWSARKMRLEEVHGRIPDISLYTVQGWCFVDNNDNERKLECWLGPAEEYG